MRISTRARYGLRVIVELAREYGKGPITVREIARRQELSRKYIERLISSMRSAGLVRAARGVNGGYVLARTPREVSVLEVFSLLEGSAPVVDCLDEHGFCPRQRKCVTRGIWEELDRAVRKTLGARTVADLAEQRETRGTVRGPRLPGLMGAVKGSIGGGFDENRP